MIVLPSGDVRLLDFGSAIAEGVCGGITNPGDFVGTFAYAAPEQILGEEVDGQVDVYALGILFYRHLTGKMPFTAENRYRLAQQHLRDAPRAPCRVRAGILVALSELVMVMLAKAPSDRPSAATIGRWPQDGPPMHSPETIGQRLSALRPVARRLMQALAVAGEPVDDETLVHMTDIPLDQMHNILADLESENWIERARNSSSIGDLQVGAQLISSLREARHYLLQTRLKEFRRLLTNTIC